MADDPTLTTADDVVSSDDDDNEQHQPLNDVVSPSPSPSPPPSSSAAAVTPTPPSFTVALAATPERKPIDDSRRLFQRLWTDEDEIELLRGYLDYTSARGGGGAVSGHHYDTTAFYDQIKNKLQLEFNKNQLVEKLRRLKKKYRNVISKMSSGKEFVFKSPHDHATFEISRKIWSNLCSNLEFDDSDHNTNINPNLSNSAAGGGLLKLSTTRKRLREPDRFLKYEDNNVYCNSNDNNYNNDNAVVTVVSNDFVKNVGVSSSLQVFVEETIKNCVSPVLKDLVNNTVVNCETNANQCTGDGEGGGGASVGVKGVEELALYAMPLHFPRVNIEGGMDEKWRKQQIIELEVYSKRLELVQDQIKSTLDELKSLN